MARLILDLGVSGNPATGESVRSCLGKVNTMTDEIYPALDGKTPLTDARLSDARTPTTHTHAGADINSGTVAVARIGSGTKDTTTFYRGDGAFAVPPSGTGGAVSDASTTIKGVAKLSTAPSVATDPIAAGTNDSRLTDARTPTAHAHSGADITSGTVAVARIGTGTKDATTFYNGLGAFAVPPAGTGGAAVSTTIVTLRRNNARWERINDATAGLTSAQVTALRISGSPIMWICPVGSEPVTADGRAAGDIILAYS